MGAGTKRVAPQAIKARRAPMVTRSESRGSSPARTASQTDRARPAPPTSSLSSGKGKASVDDGRPWTSMPGGAAVRGTVAESAEAEVCSPPPRFARLSEQEEEDELLLFSPTQPGRLQQAAWLG